LILLYHIGLHGLFWHKKTNPTYFLLLRELTFLLAFLNLHNINSINNYKISYNVVTLLIAFNSGVA